MTRTGSSHLQTNNGVLQTFTVDVKNQVTNSGLFVSTTPTFYEEYFAARVVVDSRGGRSDNTDVQPTPTPQPA